MSPQNEKIERVAFFPSLEILASNPYWSTLAQSLESIGLKVEKKGYPSFSLQWLLANRGKIKILHLHYVQQFYAFEHTQARLIWVLRFARNLIAARILGYRTVFTLHNLRPSYQLHPAWVDRLGHWIGANLTNSVIVHCEKARQLLAQEFGRKSAVYIVPHPNYEGNYPNEITKEAARDRLGLSAEHIVFVFFGGIRPNKGLENLIDSFHQLPGDQYRLLIAGYPWPPKEYVEGIRKRASVDIRILLFLEPVPNEEIQLYLKAGDIAVLPFDYILTSGSVMLAMTFGRPIVAPSMGCLPELVTPECGWLYNFSEENALGNTLRLCVGDNFQQKGLSAKKKAQSVTVEIIGSLTYAAYKGRSI